jgi:Domain of Unknown Function (DUF1080)
MSVVFAACGLAIFLLSRKRQTLGDHTMLKRCFAIGLFLSLTAALLAADDKPKHNTLTPKEIADGWILLFDGETTFGWQSPNGSKWTIAEGILAPQADKQGLLITTTAFADYELKLDYFARLTDKDSAHLLINCDREGKKFTYGHLLRSYDSTPWWTLSITVKDGIPQEATASPTSDPKRKFSTSPPKSDGPEKKPMKQAGFIALRGNGLVVRNIKLKPLDTKPLFNGKDLTGWKKFTGDEKRAKTEFSVTPEGWLHLKNGPGDLQTEKQFADFVLQAECRTNGKHLNSGIFFRCIPDQYQNGYEAQIHNGWTEKPEKELVIEEYDPETHKLKGKEKIKSAALDYGTGAIYRRVPARRQVAKDNEWFTMTVVAEGRHIATWVDGVQVVDWTDNRPLNDNPRNGCRLEKGAISLQGHDPTTDLNFRNIRIEELPSK